MNRVDLLRYRPSLLLGLQRRLLMVVDHRTMSRVHIHIHHIRWRKEVGGPVQLRMSLRMRSLRMMQQQMT